MKKILLLLFTVTLFSGLNAQSEWVRLNDIPGPARNHPISFVIGDYGYKLTGLGDNAYLDDFYRYSFSDGTWEKLPDFPGGARAFGYGVTHDGKAYVGFGRSPSQLFNDLWEYDPVTEQWTALATCGCVGRRHPAMVATDNGKVFVGMGDLNPSTNYRDWWEYDISTDVWTQKSSLPGAERHHPYYFGIGDTAYVGFGHSGPNIYKDFYKWDSSNDTWTRLGDFPGEGRVAGEQFSLNGKGYIISGQGEDHRDLDTGEMHVYHPDLDLWFEKDPHPGTARWAPGTFVHNNAVYIFGGQVDVTPGNRGNLSSMYFYQLEPSVSTEEFADKGSNEMRVYPNPIESKFQITHKDISSISSIRLISMEGKVSIVHQLNQNEFELPKEAKQGSYILELALEDGEVIRQSVSVK